MRRHVIVLLLALICCRAQNVRIRFKNTDLGLVKENENQVEIFVEKLGRTNKTFTAFLELEPKSEDFFSTRIPVIFYGEIDQDNVTTTSVFATTKDDNIPETNETFTFRLRANPSFVQVVDPMTAHVTILANDDTHGIIEFQNELSPLFVDEMSNMNTSISLFLVRERGFYGNVTVTYRIEHTKAEEQVKAEQIDIFPAFGTITLSDGESEKEFVINVLDDEIPENDESFTITLTSTTGGLSINENKNSMEIVVRKNDCPIKFAKKIYRVKEDVGYLDVTVLRGHQDKGGVKIGPTGGQITFDYQVIPGSAQQPEDYFVSTQNISIGRFDSFQLSTNIRVEIKNDDIAELAENFTINILPDRVIGDAVAVQPSTCTIIIEPNDKPNGVISIDFTKATFEDEGNNENSFIIDTDQNNTFNDIALIRNGGSFNNISINWELTSNSSDSVGLNLVSPTSGIAKFTEGQEKVVINLRLQQDNDFHESDMMVFRLLPNTIQGGAEIEFPHDAIVYLSDSKDVYGVISFDKTDEKNMIQIDRNEHHRDVMVWIKRTEGLVGDVQVFYSAYYLLPTALNIEDSMPGVLQRKNGNIIIKEDENEHELRLVINEDAFLEINAEFVVVLDSVKLVNKELIIPAKSPRICSQNVNTSVLVTSKTANSEIGFEDSSDLLVTEPSFTNGPLEVSIALFREGVSNDALVHLSYRSVGDNKIDLVEGTDYILHNDVVDFKHGVNKSLITLEILPDDLPELNETLVIRLDSVSPTNQKLMRSASEKKIIIVENDSPGGVFQFTEESVKHYTVKENDQEVIILTVEREQGDLITRKVMYEITPGSQEFLATPDILVFPPGVTSRSITLVPLDDVTPELETNFTLTLLPHGNPASVLGERTTIHVTVQANDNPFGLFEFEDNEVHPRSQTIDEVKGIPQASPAHYEIKRKMGTFSNVTVQWRVAPDDTGDVTPLGGVLEFLEGETKQIISLYSVPDFLPESIEEYTIILFDATNGANIGFNQNATLFIRPNDKAIYFLGENEVSVVEGEPVNLKVHRDGLGATSTRVKIRTLDLSNSSLPKHIAMEDVDYNAIGSKEIVFLAGNLDYDISIQTANDTEPEDNESFYVELFDAEGDYVTSGNTKVKVTITHNDNSGGVLSFEQPAARFIKEGIPTAIRINRSEGLYGDVSVQWKVFRGVDILYDDLLYKDIKDLPKDEFLKSKGMVSFIEDQSFADILLEARSDFIPEYQENFTLILTNVTEGNAILSLNKNFLSYRIFVETNDYPYGYFAINPESSNVDLSEDDFDEVTVMVDRTLGSDGDVKALWEIYPINSTVPTECIDLMLGGVGIGEILYEKGRPNTSTFSVRFKPDSYMKNQEVFTDYLDQFSISLWIQVDSIKQGYLPLITKFDESSSIVYTYGITTQDDKLISATFTYRTMSDSSTNISVEIFAKDDILLNQITYVVFVKNDGAFTVYINGMKQESKIEDALILQSSSSHFQVGGKVEDDDIIFTGALQDVRLYMTALSPETIMQFYEMPAMRDVTPVNGYIDFLPMVTSATATLQSVDDSETEYNELFDFALISATGGAVINSENGTSTVTVLKSDYANGLFGFLLPCQPQNVTEGDTVTCFVNRSYGLTGVVTLGWSAIYNEEKNNSDFVESVGTVLFLEGEDLKSFELTTIDDDVPEITELHLITITNVTSHDDNRGNSFSGAHIDEDHASTEVFIEENDNPYGVLQFSVGTEPTPSDNGQLPIDADQPTIHVNEEDGYVTLLVVRAEGWFGDVEAEWKTKEDTALSSQEPRDFQSSAGTIFLEDGVGFTTIQVKLIDDEEAELEKMFYVELLNPTGGVMLNNASVIKVIISPSDDAFGVFQFSQTTVEVTEPDTTGTNNAILEITRNGGSLGEVVLAWEIGNGASNDVNPLSGEITFTEGQTSAFIEVDILSDSEPEFDDVIPVKLVKVSRGSLASSNVTCNIIILANDDVRGLIVFDPTLVTTHESDGNATLTIKRLRGQFGTIRVYYETMDNELSNLTRGIAYPLEDYRPTVDSILMPENVSSVQVVIHINNDPTPEAEEIFFVKLTKVELVSSGVQVPNSPRLGPELESQVEILIEENDHPNGILVLSSTSLTVDEDNLNDDDFLYVDRTMGLFGDITVGLTVKPGKARAQEDYNLLSTQVSMLDGESRKAIPLKIINDFAPEEEEDFVVKLIPGSTTGGAEVGGNDSCRVTIDKSDDPYGVLDISVDQTRVDEPHEGNSAPITFTVHRRMGLKGLISVKWEVEISPAPSATDQEFSSSNLADGGRDVDTREGFLHFATNDDEEEFTIKVLPDSIPEDDEQISVRLTEILSERGRIDLNHNVANVVVPANDRPYGDVSFKFKNYDVMEFEDRNNYVEVELFRSGGTYGTMRAVYSTLEVDLVTEMLERNESLLRFYETPKILIDAGLEYNFQKIDITSSLEPLVTCSETCLRERLCVSFVYNEYSYECKWMTKHVDNIVNIVEINERNDRTAIEDFKYYRKNETEISILLKSKAKSGMDFISLSGASVLLGPGDNTTNINITILEDDIPELNEYFMIKLLKVEMVGIEPDQTNKPIILEPSLTRISVQENDNPYGEFIFKDFVVKDFINVEERQDLSLQMTVERLGGSVGNVSVDWSVVGGTASRNSDFTGDDATIKFGHGETRKVVSLSVIDDSVPEPDEDIILLLSNPTGGSVVSKVGDKAKVVILANDIVGGIIGFAANSMSVIGQEGGNVTFELRRSEPALGSCNVTWYAESVTNHDVTIGLNDTEGFILFDSQQIKASMLINLTPDSIPEVKEVYNIILSHVESYDISPSGSAILDPRSSTGEITIRESDNPHGVFRIAPNSLRLDVKEEGGGVEIFVNRLFGSIGSVRVYYQVISGTLTTVNPDLLPAEPGIDFISDQAQTFVEFKDGDTSVPIVIEIVDDNIAELNEIFYVNLTRVELLGDIMTTLPPQIDDENSLSQVVIDANDGTKGVISFDPDSINIFVSEIAGANSTVRLQINRDRGLYGEVNVFVFPQNDEATLEEDFKCIPTTVVFGDSEDRAYYDITILDDVIPEDDEVFMISLGNPSEGVQLGELTQASVTIKSNDDAHGRLSFDNDEIIYLKEPDSESFEDSVAQLIISRNPTEGVFGEISVQYKIERMSAKGKLLEGNVEDLFPIEGEVVIEDGVGFDILEIAAVADDKAELDERFLVTLFDPQEGATLDTNRITTEIIVEANDAPYGQFTVYPNGIRSNSREYKIEEGPGHKIFYFDVVRSQGTLGHVAVDVYTVPGTAKPVLPSTNYPPFFTPFQTFKSSNVEYFHSFQFNGGHYLVMLTSDLKQPMHSNVGSDGTMSSLQHGIHSTLYKWQGIYMPVQTIETDGASCAATFKSGDDLYLVITNEGEEGRRGTSSRLYKFSSEKEELTLLDNVNTVGASSVTTFDTSTSDQFVVIANRRNKNMGFSSVESVVLKFNPLTESLNIIQSFRTKDAAATTAFYFKDNLYLAIANSYDSDSSDDAAVQSAIYIWKDSSFKQQINVPVNHANYVKHYVVEGKLFLVFSMSEKKKVNGDKPNSNQGIKIFQVYMNDVENNLLLSHHQYLNVTSPQNIEITTLHSTQLCSSIEGAYKDNNSNALMLSASSSQLSQVFLFNHTSNLFSHWFSSQASKQIYPQLIKTNFSSSLVFAIATDTKSQTNHSTNQLTGIYNMFNVHPPVKQYNYSALAGDYIPIPDSTQLVFGPGESVHTMVMTIMDDQIPEINEMFQIALGNSDDSRAVVNDESNLEVVITSNDDAYGVIGFSQECINKNVEELSSDTPFNVKVVRNKSVFGAVTVDWRAEGSINEVVPISGQILFEEGVSVVGIEMVVLADDIPEIGKTVEIYLSNPRLFGINESTSQPRINATTSKATINLLANDSPHGVVRWATNSLRTVVSEAETMAGASQLVMLDLVREQGTVGDIEVYFKTELAPRLPLKSQATPGVDFINRDSSLVMRENVTRGAVAISIIPDDIPEDIESFLVVIYDVKLIGESNVEGKPGLGQPGSEIAEVTIEENDNSRGIIQFNVTRNVEGAVDAYELPRVNNTLKLPLQRLVGLSRAVGVNWRAIPNTAKNDAFFPSSGSVQFSDGQQASDIIIWIRDDDEVEFMETFTVQLISAYGGALLGGDTNATIHILPNDSPSGMFGFIQKMKRVKESSYVNDPAGAVEFQVKRFQGSNEDVTVLWEVEKSASYDLTPVSGNLFFPTTARSKSIFLRTLPDDILEGEETYTITLKEVTGEAEISPVANTAKVIIEANAGSGGTVSVLSKEIITSEPTTTYNGVSEIKLTRGPGLFGKVEVEWQIIPSDASVFEIVKGKTSFAEGKDTSKIVLRTIDNKIPEELKKFVLRLTGTSEGATINSAASTSNILLVASDNPYGSFEFAQPTFHVKEGVEVDQRRFAESAAPLVVTSFKQTPSFVVVPVVRKDGKLGEVAVNILTQAGTALSNSDFYPVNQRLIFTAGEMIKNVKIEIIDDSVPEGPNYFYVNITAVQLLSPIANDFIPLPPHNLTKDLPPAIGSISSTRVVIDKSDGAEGVVEFASVNGENKARVNEGDGTIEIELVRVDGSYGGVQVTVTPLNETSTASRNVDFMMPSSGKVVNFEDGQTSAFLSIPLIDDENVEEEEKLMLIISDVAGGAGIGKRDYFTVIINKSDFPNGVLQFVDDNSMQVFNQSTNSVLAQSKLDFVFERVGGNMLPATVHWQLVRTEPFFKPTTSKTPLRDDFAPPYSGEFYFNDGEGGQRTISLNLLSSDVDNEPEETYMIYFDVHDPIEISETKGNVTLTVLKKGHPNGVVSFDNEEDLQIIEEPMSGQTQVVFPIARNLGVEGDINVRWLLIPSNRTAGACQKDVERTTGSVIIYDGQSKSEIIVNVLADESPELDETFDVFITRVDGGAEIDSQNNKSRRFTISGNDDPHGVFSIYPEYQKTILTPDLQRLLQVNVTRNRGLFGRVLVGFRASFENPQPGVSYLTTNTGTLQFPSDSEWAVESLEISSSVFLEVGEQFQAQLTSVEYMGDVSDVIIDPRISMEDKSTVIKVAPEVGNPQIGFDSTVAQVQEIGRHVCKLKLDRVGLFGSVKVHWSAGYPPQLTPSGFNEGGVAPGSGVIELKNQQSEGIISLTLMPKLSQPELFAVHLGRVFGSGTGGARLLRNKDLVEIDPCGAVRFAPFSQKITVDRRNGEFNLTVERMYGSRYDIDVYYQLIADSAQPNIDYIPLSKPGLLRMMNGQVESRINVKLIREIFPEKEKRFYVNLTLAEQPQNVYRALSPRVIPQQSHSEIIISESSDARGVIGFKNVELNTTESLSDGSPVSIMMVQLERKGGTFGEVSVMVSTVSGGAEWSRKVQNLPATASREGERVLKVDQLLEEKGRAKGDVDYEIRNSDVTFKEGSSTAVVPVVILNDNVAEADEYFLLYLHSATGGAKICEKSDIAKIVIRANDLPNGAIGFQHKMYFIDEDKRSRTSEIMLTRTNAFGDVTVNWRATAKYPTHQDIAHFAAMTTAEPAHDTSLAWKRPVGLNDQLVTTEGTVTCIKDEYNCGIKLSLADDDVPEFSETFYLVLDDVTSGAEIDEARRIANVTIKDSDFPYGMFQFAPSSRLPVVTKGTKTVGLTVQRLGGDSEAASVRCVTFQPRHVTQLAGSSLYPAVSGVDYTSLEEVVNFAPGEREKFIQIDLKETSSTNPLPQLFQLKLESPSGKSVINRFYHTANITIIENESTKRIWGVFEALQQELTGRVVENVVSQLHDMSGKKLGKEQLNIFHASLDTVIDEGTKRKLKDSSLKSIYNTFCELLNPGRKDAVVGYSEFSKSLDHFSRCLTTQSECLSSDANSVKMSSCDHMTLQSVRWYPELINGHSFSGKSGDFFELPVDLLKVGDPSEQRKCYDLHFIEYTSKLWFTVNGEKSPMSNKVFSVGIDNEVMTSLKSPVRYRVYTKDARISPQGAECVLWNEASSKWLPTTNDVCRVVNDDFNYVDCECNHMSVYAARGPTDNLAGYNEATYVACFITAVGAILTLLGHHLCSRRSTFAAKILMHMCWACAATQLLFVLGAMISKSANPDGCATLGILLHYFWLAQFTWILMQCVNILQILSLSNEQAQKLFAVHFIIGWGFPAVAVILYVIIMYALGSKSLYDSYGDLHANGDLCMIMNTTGALLGAIAPACFCMIVVIMTVIHLYARDKAWKQYDDVYRGRLNGIEIPLLFWLYFLIAITWLWGGLHLAFGHMWLLVLFIVFNFLQGIFFLVVYGILHNQVVWPTKDIYQDGIIKSHDMLQGGTAFQTTAVVGSRVPSVSGDVINKSSQNLMPKFDADWTGETNAEVMDENAEDDSTDFDDLMFALKSDSKNNKPPGNRNPEMKSSSPITAARQHIADTHL